MLAETLSGSVILGRQRPTVPGQPRAPAEGRHVSEISAHFLILLACEKILFLAWLGWDSTHHGRSRAFVTGSLKTAENNSFPL